MGRNRRQKCFGVEVKNPEDGDGSACARVTLDGDPASADHVPGMHLYEVLVRPPDDLQVRLDRGRRLELARTDESVNQSGRSLKLRRIGTGHGQTRQRHPRRRNGNIQRTVVELDSARSAFAQRSGSRRNSAARLRCAP